MLEVNRDTVCGLVHGRGVHSSCQYLFGEKRRWDEFGTTLVECEHGNIGLTMISRKLFEAVRFRYGMSVYPDGRAHVTSDDPAFHLDAFIKFGQWPVLRMDVVGRHVRRSESYGRESILNAYCLHRRERSICSMQGMSIFCAYAGALLVSVGVWLWP